MLQEDKEKILKMRIQGLGYKAIALALGISRDSVKSYCKRNSLSSPPEDVKLSLEENIDQVIGCTNCNNPIKQKHRGRSRRFCSDECRRKWWNKNQDKRNRKETAVYKYTCGNCGKEFSCYGNKKRKFCSHKCFIEYRFGGVEEDESISD